MHPATLTISIVSYNNLKFLVPCLNSIIQHTKFVNYNIYVVAYKFNRTNLIFLKDNYPNIKIIKNDRLRGYSENQNLALKKARSKYCLILNDDTYFVDNSIKILIDTMEQNEEIHFISPIILNPDNTVQYNGRRKYTIFYRFLVELGLDKYFNKNKYENKSNIYTTYNISGACFLVRSSVIRKLNYFDEGYFFTPEDIALSTKANKLGFNCNINTNAKIYHINSATANEIKQVILPVSKLGFYYFWRTYYGGFVESAMRIFDANLAFIKYLYWFLHRNGIMRKTYLNIMINSFKKNITPKELFSKLYYDLRNMDINAK